jgi:lipopolysaccharide export system protein LptA
MFPRLLPLLAFVAIVLAQPVHAVSSDRDQPINFSGDTGDADLQKRGGTLTGNVIITQGTLSIHADRIVFKQNPDNSLSATAYGNPVALRQKREGYDEYYEGYAQRVEYDGSKDFVELFDHALLKRGQDEIRSNYVSYNVATEVFRAEGRPSAEPDPGGLGARVRGMFQPKSEGTTDAGKDTGKGKAPAKDAAKGKEASKAPEPKPTEPSAISLKPAGELATPSASAK